MRVVLGIAFLASFLWAQQRPPAAAPKVAPPAVAPPKPLQTQSYSTVTQSVNKNGEHVVDIRNVAYRVAGGTIPGLKPDDRLLLRVSTRNRQVIEEPGVRATVTLEAWPVGSDPKLKPMYQTTITGTGAEVTDFAVWVVSRGLEETEWWTILKLATTQPLFDTFTPLVHFSISRETLTERYAGLDVPTDESRSARLKDPHAVGVLEYASGDGVIREALITCDDTNRAGVLRSTADTSRTLTGSMDGLTATISEDYPATPNTVTITVPIANDDLDLAHAKLPAGMHIAELKR